MTITKTMQGLLDRAKTNPEGLGAVTTSWGRGSHGGSIKFGCRERKALQRLVELKLVEIVDKSEQAFPSRGYTQWFLDQTYRVVDTMPTDDHYLSALSVCSK